ncbi:MAG: acyltransferase family protein [Clostridiales bacterium]|nr:acyltransferase family protein [Clostridiales bacterium]
MKFSNTITSISSGPRQSNVELLRIFAMFMVLCLHANFWSLGEPSGIDYSNSYTATSLRVLAECLCIPAVNIFILISGWFTIKFSYKGIASFLFQCFFIVFISFIIYYSVYGFHLNFGVIKDLLLFTPDLWFIHSYLGLYILSPILNKFIETATKRQFTITLVTFYLFQSTYGLFADVQFIGGGYSAFSFAGLYLIASYIRQFYNTHQHLKKLAVAGLSLFSINSLLYTFCNSQGIYYYTPLIYSNPFVIAGAVGFLCSFLLLTTKTNSNINYIAKGCFAVYILHQSPFIGRSIFAPLIVQVNDYCSLWAKTPAIIATLIAIYLVALVIDIPRRFIWNWICHIPMFKRFLDKNY